MYEENKKQKEKKKWYLRWWMFVIYFFIFSVILAFINDDGVNTNNVQPTAKVNEKQVEEVTATKTKQTLDLSKIEPPAVSGYKRPITTVKDRDIIALSYEPTGSLGDKVLSIGCTIILKKNSEIDDYSNLKEEFPIENQEIEIEGFVGRFGYQDSFEMNGIVLTNKYESLQIEVDTENLNFGVQITGVINTNFEKNKVLYKTEAKKVLEALISSYK